MTKPTKDNKAKDFWRQSSKRKRMSEFEIRKRLDKAWAECLKQKQEG